jgi:hypothetical protein
MSIPTPMQIPAHAPKDFAAELWTSLISLLKSHAAMRMIARPGASVRVTGEGGTATLLGRAGKLILTAPDQSGIGSAEFRPQAADASDAYSTFFFTEDGLIQVQDADAALDLEMAAERWLGRVQA